MKFKLGCDPEFFLNDGMEYVSAHDVFPGTKRNPHKLEKGSIQVDGTAGEFGIDPAETAEEFDNNIEVVLSQVKEILHKHNPELEMEFTPFVQFDPIYFACIPFQHQELGCDPDYDRFGTMKVPAGEHIVMPIRTAAGHVHIGWTKDKNPLEDVHFNNCRQMSNMFLREKFFFPVTSEERNRIDIYGTPGSFRPKPYGVELRSPSNLWVKESNTRREMFNTVQNRLKGYEVSDQ